MSDSERAWIETVRSVVHPWHCDVMGHVTTRHYVGFFDDAGHQLVGACGAVTNLGSQLGFADVKATYEYLAELKCGDLLLIRSAFERIGTSSFVAAHEITRCGSAEVVARALVTSVRFDLEGRRATPLSAEFVTEARRLCVETATGAGA